MVAWVGFGGRSQAEIEEVGRAGREEVAMRNGSVLASGYGEEEVVGPGSLESRKTLSATQRVEGRGRAREEGGKEINRSMAAVAMQEQSKFPD